MVKQTNVRGYVGIQDPKLVQDHVHIHAHEDIHWEEENIQVHVGGCKPEGILDQEGVLCCGNEPRLT